MNAPLRPEVRLRVGEPPQAALPMATAGVLRYVWEGRWGSMLIEVVADDVFVNGQRVVPHETPPGVRPGP